MAHDEVDLAVPGALLAAPHGPARGVVDVPVVVRAGPGARRRASPPPGCGCPPSNRDAGYMFAITAASDRFAAREGKECQTWAHRLRPMWHERNAQQPQHRSTSAEPLVRRRARRRRPARGVSALRARAAGALKFVSFAAAATHGVDPAARWTAAPRSTTWSCSNPTDVPVLLYEGEEVLGAQQNRTFDVSVLVAARRAAARAGELRRGRPLGRAPARRGVRSRRRRPPTRSCAGTRTATRARACRAGMEARADQGAGLGTRSRTKSRAAWRRARRRARCTTSTRRRRDRLGELTAPCSRHDGQPGALVAIGGRFSRARLVSRADVFAALHGPLVQGYALDALEADGRAAGTVPTREDADGFVDARLRSARRPQRDGIGIGSRPALRRRRRRAAPGSSSGGELVQLTAFPDEPRHRAAPAAAPSRIRRPSRRRV